MKLKLILALLIAATGSGLMVQPQTASALSGSQFKPGRIIDDNVFFNPSGMTSSQIQNFLNAKRPSCDTNGDKPYGTTTRKQYAASKGVSTPFICLKDYKQNTPNRAGESGLCSYLSAKSNRTAAQIIYDVANACNVSPKVLLVLLQKEQSLVTDDWPWPIQYEKATGFACPDTAPCDDTFAGFFYQVHSAARQFKRYSVDSNLFNYRTDRNNNILYHPDRACGSSTVFIENQATAGLYNYTPYRPNQAALNNLYGTGDGCSAYGNRNFWRMYSDWFGSTDGTPFFRIGNTDKVYMLGAQNNYYHVPSRTVLRAFGWGEINNIVASYSSEYLQDKTFSGRLPTVARFEGDEIYLMDKGLYRHFSSKGVLNDFGYTIGDEANLPSSYRYYFRPAASVQNIVKNLANGHIFLVKDGLKRHITGPSAYNSGNPKLSSLPRIDLSKDFISSLQYGAPIYRPGTLIRAGNTSPVYVITNYDSKSYISSPSKMSEFGFNFRSVISVNQPTADAHLNTNNLDVFVVKDENNSIRLIMNGDKILAVPQSMADPSRFDLKKANLVNVTNDILSRYTPSGSITELIRADDKSKVYLVENGTKRHVSSPAKLSSLGYSFSDVTNVSEYLVNLLPTGPAI